MDSCDSTGRSTYIGDHIGTAQLSVIFDWLRHKDSGFYISFPVYIYSSRLPFLSPIQVKSRYYVLMEHKPTIYKFVTDVYFFWKRKRFFMLQKALGKRGVPWRWRKRF